MRPSRLATVARSAAPPGNSGTGATPAHASASAAPLAARTASKSRGGGARAPTAAAAAAIAAAVADAFASVNRQVRSVGFDRRSVAADTYLRRRVPARVTPNEGPNNGRGRDRQLAPVRRRQPAGERPAHAHAVLGARRGQQQQKPPHRALSGGAARIYLPIVVSSNSPRPSDPVGEGRS